MNARTATMLAVVCVTISSRICSGAGNLEDGPEADLSYDPADGSVELDASDTASGVILSFVFATDQNNMRPENAQFPFIDTGTNTDATVFEIGQIDTLNIGAGPLIELGEVFPPGIQTVVELSEYITRAEYNLGDGVGSLDLIVVPEPSDLVLVLFVLLGLTLRRSSPLTR